MSLLRTTWKTIKGTLFFAAVGVGTVGFGMKGCADTVFKGDERYDDAGLIREWVNRVGDNFEAALEWGTSGALRFDEVDIVVTRRAEDLPDGEGAANDDDFWSRDPEDDFRLD
ncbi:MAG: hypothetical protein ACLFU1_03130 [Alphaproteobacteria bacterium]